MITVNHLTVDFGKQLLFDDISFVVGDREHVALVGKNGAGKTTLLKILSGLEQPTKGTVSTNKGLQIGYLPQVMNFKDVRTLWQEAESIFANVREKEQLLEVLTNELAQRQDHDSEDFHLLLERFTTLNDQLTLSQTNNYTATIEKTLLGLGFERTDFNRPTSEFSGGWRMRVELAKILLAKPDLLLLDEPTNHLDIESIEWLENYIKNAGVSLILVSHDQAFLDATTQRTLEIELGKLYDYKVNYSHYVTLRQERLETQRRAFENQQKLISDTESFIERFRYKPTKSAQVQSRIKQLEKLERIELDDIDRKKIHFRFPVATRSGDYPLIVDNLSKSFGNKQVFTGVNFTLKRGEKVAFLGKNGSGKTTLLRCIMNEITDYQGILKLGHNVAISYFSQNRAQELDPKLTIRETLDRAAVGDIRLHINDMLGAFMFGGELADKPVSVLSGGERSRLAVLLLLLSPSNLLILDEPTNHLDIQSKEVLKEAIEAYTGTVILVSHDRYFLSGLVQKVYEFDTGKVYEHLGGMEEYLRKRREKLDSTVVDAGQQSTTVTQQPPKTEAQQNYQDRKEQQKKVRALRKQLSEIEDHIAELESSIDGIEHTLAQNTLPPDTSLYEQHQANTCLLNKKLLQWEEIATQLQEYEKSL